MGKCAFELVDVMASGLALNISPKQSMILGHVGCLFRHCFTADEHVSNFFFCRNEDEASQRVRQVDWRLFFCSTGTLFHGRRACVRAHIGCEKLMPTGNESAIKIARIAGLLGCLGHSGTQR